MVNTKARKGIFWGVIIASSVVVINVLHFLLGGSSAYARGPGHGGMGHQGMGPRGGGFGGRHMMNGPHHGGGFPWLFLIVGLVVLVLLIKWLRKRSKTSSMKQFIDTSMMSSHIPVSNQNGNLLDQWENNLKNKKENE